MFNNDFYPTPEDVIDMMMSGIEFKDKGYWSLQREKVT